MDQRDHLTDGARAAAPASDRKTAPARPTGSSSDLLTSMSHDLRTPMNGVLGMAELLLAADDLGDRHRRRVEIIKRSGETLLTMLDHIIELFRIDAEGATASPSPLDLRELVLKALRQFRSTDQGESIDVDLVDELDDHHHVVGDVTRLEHLLEALLKTAADVASEPRLRVIFTAKPAAAEHVQIRLAAEANAIDTEALEGQLNALASGEQPTPDSLDRGRNLTICRKLTEMIGGDVAFERRASGRLMLRVDVSLAAVSAPDDKTPTPKACEAAGSAPQKTAIRNVLVAEDDPDMALLIEDLLDDAGYRATAVSDGASVLALMDQKSFDIVLMDGKLPDMTGFEAAGLIRSLPDERAQIPIIALTGDALAGDRERYLSAGMDDYIAKPVSYAALVDTIERCRVGEGSNASRRSHGPAPGC